MFDVMENICISAKYSKSTNNQTALITQHKVWKINATRETQNSSEAQGQSSSIESALCVRHSQRYETNREATREKCGPERLDEDTRRPAQTCHPQNEPAHPLTLDVAARHHQGGESIQERKERSG